MTLDRQVVSPDRNVSSLKSLKSKEVLMSILSFLMATHRDDWCQLIAILTFSAEKNSPVGGHYCFMVYGYGRIL